MLLAGRMQLVPDQRPRERLLVSMEVEESLPGDGSDSPFVLKRRGAMSRTSRWLFIGAAIGALLLSVTGIVIHRYRDENGKPLSLRTFIKARTSGLPATPVVVDLSTDMVRVSAISLGHPRVAVINGNPVLEGESVTLQARNASVALILRVVKIGEGSIQFTDGKALYSAQITIRSPVQVKSP